MLNQNNTVLIIVYTEPTSGVLHTPCSSCCCPVLALAAPKVCCLLDSTFHWTQIISNYRHAHKETSEMRKCVRTTIQATFASACMSSRQMADVNNVAYIWKKPF